VKKALITGITGQDGSYLAELLLAKGYEVHGVLRRSSSFNTERIEEIYQDPHAPDYRLRLVYGDLDDGSSLASLVKSIRPDEIYNLGAQSHVRVSFDIPNTPPPTVSLGTLRLLEAVRELGGGCRFYQASSSEMFGGRRRPRASRPRSSRAAPTPAPSCSPTTCARTTARPMASTSVAASCSTTSRHGGASRSSRARSPAPPRASNTAWTTSCSSGNLDAKRDWGYAGDYVEAMWLMLQQEAPDDYVIATGESHSVREVLDVAFGALGLDWKPHVQIDPRYFRPTEVDHLLGDYSKARRKLGWQPKVKFQELITMMVRADEEDVRGALAGRAPRT
jgi:GDPmannose 4,6-dehydratase